MNSEAWVSIDAIARHLDVSKDTVYRWIDQREMPAHKVGWQWKFKISEVDSWVRAGRAGEDTDRIPRFQIACQRGDA
jgi:excisionase family DNA binding protein